MATQIAGTPVMNYMDYVKVSLHNIIHTSCHLISDTILYDHSFSILMSVFAEHYFLLHNTTTNIISVIIILYTFMAS